MDYNFSFLQTAETSIANLPDNCVALQNLRINPRQDAIPTNIPFMGEYYIKCGEYSILINIDDSTHVVELCDVIKHKKLLEFLG